MTLQDIKDRMAAKSILFSEDSISERPTAIAYVKKFKWRWFATQLNTFIVASDFGEEPITVPAIEGFLTESFQYAADHYSGWPRGLQSAVGVIGILLSQVVEEEAKRYCWQLKAGKKWAGFSVPVAIDTSANQVCYFAKNPVWGRIYYPYFKSWIVELT